MEESMGSTQTVHEFVAEVAPGAVGSKADIVDSSLHSQGRCATLCFGVNVNVTASLILVGHEPKTK